jgi:hypothetical protein
MAAWKYSTQKPIAGTTPPSKSLTADSACLISNRQNEWSGFSPRSAKRTGRRLNRRTTLDSTRCARCTRRNSSPSSPPPGTSGWPPIPIGPRGRQDRAHARHLRRQTRPNARDDPRQSGILPAGFKRARCGRYLCRRPLLRQLCVICRTRDRQEFNC